MADYWFGLPQQVRKTWPYYGALHATYTLFSGRDPCNYVYAFAWRCQSGELPHWHPIHECNHGTLGDIIESLLGYCWWLDHRPGVPDAAIFRERVLADFHRGRWSVPRVVTDAMWETWRLQLPLRPVVALMEELVLLCEELIRQRPGLFTRNSASFWDWHFEGIRLGAIP